MSPEIAQADISKMSFARQVAYLASQGYGLEDIALATKHPRAVVLDFVKGRKGWPSWWVS